MGNAFAQRVAVGITPLNRIHEAFAARDVKTPDRGVVKELSVSPEFAGSLTGLTARAGLDFDKTGPLLVEAKIGKAILAR